MEVVRQGRQRIMSAVRIVIGVAVVWLLSANSPVIAGDDDPSARWVSVYGWMQTGERLAAANQWPLAMGSYLESHRQISELTALFPDFEPELVTYRTEKLEESIASAESRLTSDEHAIMMKYLDFIESLELGQAQRFRNEFETSLATLDMAKSLLDDIISRKPAEFREAVESQYQRLESSIEWVNSQIDYKERSRRASYARASDDRGTTQFVKESDLPRSEDGAVASGILFPVSLASLVTATAPTEEEVIDFAGDAGAGPTVITGPKIDDGATGPGMNFRMSSKRQMDKTPDSGDKALR